LLQTPGSLYGLPVKKHAIKSIELRKSGPFWAVYVDNDMLAVTLYKKGGEAATALLEKLTSRRQSSSEPKAKEGSVRLQPFNRTRLGCDRIGRNLLEPDRPVAGCLSRLCPTEHHPDGQSAEQDYKDSQGASPK